MPKKLIITIELDDAALAGRAAKFGAEEFASLFCGMDNGAVDGSVVSVTPVGCDDPPIVAEVVGEGVERAYTNIPNVGALRRFLEGIPDSAGFESYSGSVESLVNFGLSYGPSCDEYYDNDGSFVVTVNNEN